MRKHICFALWGLGIILILVSGGVHFYGSEAIEPAVAPLPEQLVGLPLSMKMTGTQATREFDMLHNQHFPLTSGAVGMYGEQQAALWVGGAAFKFMAAGMVTAMDNKISEGRSPFTQAGELNSGGRTIYALEGMGQKHYYFQSKNLVIWLAADPSVADEALEQTLEAFP